MDPEIETYIVELQRASAAVVLVTAGGGSQAAGWLVSVPGASRMILEATDPYSASARRAYCPGMRGGAVRAEHAAELADRAWERAARWADGGREPVGVACTAALATDRKRRGEEQAFLCVRRAAERTACPVRFRKGDASRARQEEQVSRLLLHLLGTALGLPAGPGAGEAPATTTQPIEDPCDAVYSGAMGWARVHRDGQWVAESEPAPVLFPGSFHPFHRGHDRLASAVSRQLKKEVDLELSIVNADKPPLPRTELERRLQSIQGRHRVVVTREPTFLGKARLFPGRIFIVGFDTAARLIDPVYYDGDTEKRDAALTQIRDLGCRCVVGGRFDGTRFRTVHDLPVPDAAGDLFEPMSEERFREDISATEIRERSPADAM